MRHINTYFENTQHWQSAKYLDDQMEKLRISETIKLIPQKVESIIDIGCGNGFFLKSLEILNAYKLFGLEPSKGAIKNNLSSVLIKNGTIDEMNFLDNEFDLVTCLEVIEHLPYEIYEKGLSELERIAKNYIIISVPYQENRNHVICPYCDCHFNGTTHLKSFDEKKLEKLFKNFKLIKLEKTGLSKEFRFQYLRKLFKRNLLSFGNKHICPQCNYTSRNETSLVHKKQTKNFFLPQALYRKKPIWYLALYEKV